MNSTAYDVTLTSAVKGSVEYLCVCVCVYLMPHNAPGGWARWPSCCVGGSKPLHTDMVGTVFKEETQLHKHTMYKGGNEDYNVSNHIQFISRSFKQSSEPLDRLMKKRGNIAMKTLISVDLTHLCGKQLSITHACVTCHILLTLLMKHFD